MPFTPDWPLGAVRLLVRRFGPLTFSQGGEEAAVIW